MKISIFCWKAWCMANQSTNSTHSALYLYCTTVQQYIMYYEVVQVYGSIFIASEELYEVLLMYIPYIGF